MVRQLDQPSQMYLAADILLPRPIGVLPKLGKTLRVGLSKPIENLGSS
jgi:hypothetical protein